MKKTLNILFVILLLSTSMLFAADKVKVEAAVSDRAKNACKGLGGSATKDLYDFQFEYPVGVGGGEAGVECDGNYIYTTKWNGVEFYRYDLDGTYIETFSVAGVSSVRDLAYDGQYFYGGAASTALFEMDFTPGAEILVSTITAPVAVRAIAYDPVNDGFWANNWSDQITLFDRSGATLDSFACGAVNSFYGFAWEDVLPGGPYLWGAAQSGTGNDLVKMDIANGGTQLEVYDIANSGITYAAGTDICGGLYITDEIVAGKWTIGGIVQNVSIWGLELADSAPLDAPGAPTGVTVVPDAGGALEATIDWTCPDVQVNGDPLTELTEMNVYRDEDLIYTDSSPTIGGPGSYTDPAVPSSATYAYKVVGVNSAGEGLPVIISTWVGEDVPNEVTDLLLEDLSTDTDLIAYLSWVNPTTGLHGGPFNEPILGYHVVRSDMAEFELTGVLTEWTDYTVPSIDYYSYSVTPYNSVGEGPTVVSNASMITTANVMFADDFSGGLTNWDVVNNGGTADWMIFDEPYPNEYQMPPNSIPPVCSADADVAGSGSSIDSELILATPLDCTDMIDVILDFDSDYKAIDNEDFGYVDVSVNGGVDWVNVLTYNADDVPATHEMINISEVVAGFAEVLIRFHSVQPGWDWWWTIDNVMISGVEGELGSIEGIVTDVSTSNPIEGAIVTFSGTTQTTDATGYYEFATAFPGTYTLTCEADGYYVGEEESIVLSGETTTTDFAMDPFEFATLEGTVTDLDTGDPLEGAEISMLSVLGYTYDAITGADGTYAIADIVSDTYDITCTAPMYIPQTITDIAFDPGAAVIQDFSLGLSISYFSDFEDNDGYLFSSDPNCWQWGAPTTGPEAAYSGANVWGTVLGDNYPNYSNATLDTTIPVGILSSAYILEFWHWYDIENSYDGGNVKISTDGGSSWEVIIPISGYPGLANTSHPLTGEPIYCGASAGWELAQFDMAAYVGENVLIRWHFGSDSSIPYPGWFIDDVAIYEQEYGSIEGTVTLDGGTGNVQNVLVTCSSGDTTNPDADGNYSFELYPGTYSVTAELDEYEDAMIEDVVVEEGIATTGQDLTLTYTGISAGIDLPLITELNGNYPNPFNPSTTIRFSIVDPGFVSVNIYNMKGQLVKTLVNEELEAAYHEVVWNGKDNSGKVTASGVYFYKMKASGKYTSVKKMILLK